MEILQTIWTAITNENTTLTNILCIPLAFIEVYISMLLFSAILNLNSTKKEKMQYVIIASLFSSMSRLFIPAPYNTYLNLIVILSLIMYTFKINILKAVICILFPSIISALIESIFAKIYFSIFQIEYIVGANIPLHRFIGTLLLNLIVYFVYLAIKYSKLSISNLQIQDKKKKNVLFLNIVFGVILIATQIYVTYFYSSILPIYIVLISLTSLFAYIAISIYTLFTVSKLETTSTNLEEAQLYNKTLELLQDNTRAFRHDFSNIVQGMQGYIIKNDMVGLKKYYNQLVEDIQVTNNLTTLSPKVVNNPAIYNVLASKYHKADSLGIKINLEAFMDLNELHTKIYEFTRVLGILMDNAIEASKECDEKIINVTFRNDTKKHMQLLIVENSYNNKDIDTEKIYEKGFSTKEGNSGLGLWEIRQILKKNNNLNLYTTKNDKFFSQQFEIYY